MSKTIAALLDKSEETVAEVLQKIEDLNGNPSADVRILAAQIPRLRGKITQLGLDPQDTTGEELYQALRTKFEADAQQLDQALKVTDLTALQKKIDLAAGLIVINGKLPQRWLIKHSASKRLLRQLPPKNLMKKLNYRSLESMLKHKNVAAVFMLAKKCESKTWKTKLKTAVSKLDSADFELRPLEIISLSQVVCQKMAGSNLTLSDDCLGAVAIWPANRDKQISVLALALALIQRLEKLAGSDLTDVISGLNPALRWWCDNPSLLSLHQEGPVSFNINDLAQDSLNGQDYANRSKNHAVAAFVHELAHSYEYAPQKVAEALQDIGYGIKDNLNKQKTPAGTNLAFEYAETE